MTKGTLITLYALALLAVGLLTYALGGAVADIESFADRSGAQSFLSLLQTIGLVVGLPGVGDWRGRPPFRRILACPGMPG